MHLEFLNYNQLCNPSIYTYLLQSNFLPSKKFHFMGKIFIIILTFFFHNLVIIGEPYIY